MPEYNEHIPVSPANNGGHYLVILNVKGCIVFTNSFFRQQFVPSLQYGLHYNELVFEHDLVAFTHAFNCCVTTTSTSHKGISRFIGLQNEAHYVTWEMTAEEKTGGEKSVYVVGHNLYDRTPEVNEIERSAKILKSIFDSTDIVKFFVSPNFHLQFFNRKAYENGLKLHGKKMKVGDNILDYVRDTENKVEGAFMEDFDKALKGEKVVREIGIDYKNAPNTLYFRSEYYPVYENDLLIGIYISVSDVTDRNKYEENIRLQNDKLKKIAFIQSHQVRQPLANILGILSFINVSGISEDDRYLINILKLSAHQLDSVVRNIVLEAQQTTEISGLSFTTKNIELRQS